MLCAPRRSPSRLSRGAPAASGVRARGRELHPGAGGRGGAGAHRTRPAGAEEPERRRHDDDRVAVRHLPQGQHRRPPALPDLLAAALPGRERGRDARPAQRQRRPDRAEAGAAQPGARVDGGGRRDGGRLQAPHRRAAPAARHPRHAGLPRWLGQDAAQPLLVPRERGAAERGGGGGGGGGRGDAGAGHARHRLRGADAREAPLPAGARRQGFRGREAQHHAV